MKYKYSARTKDGELQAGFVEAASRETAANVLASHELFVLSVESQEKKLFLEKIYKLFNRIKLVDLMVFTRQFATLLESEVPLSDALTNIEKHTKNAILKETAYEISSDVAAGLSLSQALERQDRIFSDFYLNMVRSAEITGRLGEVMSYLADYLDKEVAWRARIRNATIYPIFLVVLFFIVGIVLLTVVFPKLAPIFTETGAQMPLITKIFLETGNFILNWWWMILIVLIFLATVLIDYFKGEEGKNVFNELVVKIPIFGELFKKIYAARFSESLSVLIKGGVPVAQSLEIVGHNIGNIVYRDIIHDLAEGVRRGELLSALLIQNEYYFPPLVSQMVAIGENTGRLESILSKISAFYSREVENILDNLTEMIQPLLIAVIGIFVFLMFASILIPIYNLMQGIQSL
ncbi:MAG: type II secretion system F family protein [Patescibacteria group bacterium]